MCLNVAIEHKAAAAHTRVTAPHLETLSSLWTHRAGRNNRDCGWKRDQTPELDCAAVWHFFTLEPARLRSCDCLDFGAEASRLLLISLRLDSYHRLLSLLRFRARWVRTVADRPDHSAPTPNFSFPSNLDLQRHGPELCGCFSLAKVHAVNALLLLICVSCIIMCQMSLCGSLAHTCIWSVLGPGVEYKLGFCHPISGRCI